MSGDFQKLLDKARESVAAANILVDQGFNDFAVSRSYYAMFYVAEVLLASLDKQYSSHGAVQAAYGREFAKTVKLDPKFHRWLIDSQDLRNIGDYGIEAHVSLEQAQATSRWAQEFIDCAETYLNPKES